MFVTLALIAQAQAADFYVDPVGGSPDGDGSSSRPWRTLQEVVEANSFETWAWDSAPYEEGVSVLVPDQDGPVRPGDTVWLLDGHHGEVEIRSAYLDGVITVSAAPGAEPTLSRLSLRSASNWTFQGLTVSPSFAEDYEKQTMVDLESHSWTGPISDITLEDCTLYSVEDTSSWTAEDWNAYSASGIFADGSHLTIRNNLLRNVNFGISVLASDSLVEHNIVENFAGDGMRGLGDHTVFQYNTVMNSYDVNDNHDDGFQSWSLGPDGVGTGEVIGVVLRGNVFINYTDPEQPLRGPLQGIGCFDGTFVDWVVENNVVAVDHWHGITLMGAHNVRVVNNTVVDLNTDSPGPPWISVTAHKDGSPPTDSVVRNNLATDYRSHELVEEDGNLTVVDPAEHFVDYPNDLRLHPSSPAIDAGLEDLSPECDADGKPRPLGEGIDVGAYEYGEVPVDTASDTDSEGSSEPIGEDCGCGSSPLNPGLFVLALVALVRRSGWEGG